MVDLDLDPPVAENPIVRCRQDTMLFSFSSALCLPSSTHTRCSSRPRIFPSASLSRSRSSASLELAASNVFSRWRLCSSTLLSLLLDSSRTRRNSLSWRRKSSSSCVFFLLTMASSFRIPSRLPSASRT